MYIIFNHHHDLFVFLFKYYGNIKSHSSFIFIYITIIPQNCWYQWMCHNRHVHSY